jgi:hypothetical protein
MELIRKSQVDSLCFNCAKDWVRNQAIDQIRERDEEELGIKQYMKTV